MTCVRCNRVVAGLAMLLQRHDFTNPQSFNLTSASSAAMAGPLTPDVPMVILLVFTLHSFIEPLLAV